MNQPQQRNNQDSSGGILFLLALAALGLVWYIAVSRLHLTNDQCEEIAAYLAILVAAVVFTLTHLIGHRRKREELWPHPPLAISSGSDERAFEQAQELGATLLGYTVHREPMFWRDDVRMRHGILVGGSGAGKTTNLMNIVRQDMSREFNGRRMPMIILNGKGDTDFERAIVLAAEEAGRTQDLRILNPSRPHSSVRYNPFYAVDDNYQEHVNFIFGSFGLREDFFKGHQEAYLSDLVRILHYTGKRFNIYDVLVMALDEKVLEEADRSGHRADRDPPRYLRAEAAKTSTCPSVWSRSPSRTATACRRSRVCSTSSCPFSKTIFPSSPAPTRTCSRSTTYWTRTSSSSFH